MNNLLTDLATAATLLAIAEYWLYSNRQKAWWQTPLFWLLAIVHLVAALIFLQATGATNDHLGSNAVILISMLVMYVTATRIRKR